MMPWGECGGEVLCGLCDVVTLALYSALASEVEDYEVCSNQVLNFRVTILESCKKVGGRVYTQYGDGW